MNKNYFIKIFIFSLLLLPEYSLFGQDDSLGVIDGIDTNYIVSYTNIFTPRFIIIGKRNMFSIRNNDPNKEDDRVNELTFEPNDPLNVGLGFTYKWLGINLSFPLFSNDQAIYGKTRRFDLGSHLYGRKIIVDLDFSWYKGYYLSNPQNVVPGWVSGDPYPSRADISVTSLGLAGFYVFNNSKFSYRSAFTYNERQRKSAGSAIIGGGLTFNYIRADSSMVGSDYIVELDSLNINKANFANLYATGGYAHNFVIKYFFLSLSLGLGFGVSTDRVFIENISEEYRKSGISIVTVFRASVGYNRDKYYIGLSMYNNGLSIISSKNIGLSYRNTNFNFYVGYRFYHLFEKKEPLPWLWDLKL